jgi:hypothetical protein
VRITVTSGDRQVHIAVKGSSGKKLRKAERTARRLLDAGPKPTEDNLPFGFAVGADTERADRHPPREHEAE